MKFDITAKATGQQSGEVMVYGYISDTKWDDDDVTARDFDDAIKSLGPVKEITIRVNSYGGSVSAGQSMATMIDTQRRNGVKVTARIEGVGASMGAYFPQAADRLVMASNAMMMVHKPLTIAAGNSDVMLETAEMLEKTENTLVGLCMRRFKGSEDELRAMIKGNVDGTWLTAQEALDCGLCDEIDEPVEMAACAGGYRMNGIQLPTNALKGALDKIQIHNAEGGEKMIYNKEIDAKIKAALDDGKTITKDGDNIVVAEVAEAQEVAEFLTAEQVQEAAGADIKADSLLDMLHTVKDLGMKHEDVAAALKFMASEEKTKMTAKAAERDHFFDLVLTEALENGIRAEGNTFDREGWEELLKMKPLAKVKEQSDKWLAKAEAELNAGGGRRSWVPGAQASAEAPDDCFKF